MRCLYPANDVSSSNSKLGEELKSFLVFFFLTVAKTPFVGNEGIAVDLICCEMRVDVIFDGRHCGE